jgi:hypothetical protein
MESLRQLREGARNLFDRVTGADANIPPPHRDADEALRVVDAEVSASASRPRGERVGDNGARSLHACR